MKIIVTVSFLTSILFNIVPAQSRWTWQNPLPQGNTVHEVLVTDFGFVGDTRDGSILLSNDGIDWIRYRLDMPGIITDLLWAGDKLVALGDSGRVMLSEDGRNWTLHSTGSSVTLREGVWDGSKIVAVGDTGRVYVSPDGIDWTPHALAYSRAVSSGILWSGSCFYVSHDNLSYRYADSIHVSADGLTWEWTAKSGGYEIVAMGDHDGKTFAFDRKGTVFEVVDCTTWTDTAGLGFGPADVAVTDTGLWVVGSSGYRATSYDGYDWTVRQTCSGGLYGPSFTAAWWNGRYIFLAGTKGMNFRFTALGSGSGTFGISGVSALTDVACRDTTVVFVGDGGYILSGPDNGYLEPRRQGTVEALNRVIWTGTRALACGSAGSILSSPAGLSWTAESTVVAGTLRDIIHTGVFYAAAGDDGVMTSSTDGRVWKACTTNTYADFEKIIPANGGALALGLSGQTLVACWSGDGEKWTTTDVGGSIISIGGAAWSGEQVVIGADAGDIFASADCSTWTTHRSGLHQYVSGLEWQDSMYVMIHDYLMIGTSEDGTTWTERNRYGKDLWDLVWADSQWVSVGEDLTVLTSPDGISWKTGWAGIGSTDDLWEVIWTGEILLARGSSGLYSSRDGKSWTAHTHGAGHTLNSIAWTGTRFIAVGDNGTILAADMDPVSGIRDKAAVRPDKEARHNVWKKLHLKPGMSGIYFAVPGETGLFDVTGKWVPGNTQ